MATFCCSGICLYVRVDRTRLAARAAEVIVGRTAGIKVTQRTSFMLSWRPSWVIHC